MKQKFFITAICFSFVLGVVIVRTVTAAADTVESDYARDVASGEQELKSDPEALEAHEEVKQSEQAVAAFDHEELTPKDEIAPSESVEPAEDVLPDTTELLVTPEPEPTNEPFAPEPTETPEPSEAPMETP